MDPARLTASERSRFFGRVTFSLLAILALASIAVASTPGSAGDSSSPPSSDNRSAEPKNVLLITIDTLRSDATGFSGNSKASTPTMDRLAARGRIWTNTHASSVTTLPSHASLLTGLYPYQHGVRENGRFTLDRDVPTLATLLQGAGFATAAFVGAYPLDSRFGLDRGFDIYDDSYPVRKGDQTFHYSERPATEVVQRASRWWHSQAGQPRFLWIHLYDPHAPYEPREPFAGRFPDNPYLGEVAAVDAALAPLIESLLVDDAGATLVVLTSDHGEALGDHGELTHGLFAYEATLEVPLVMWGPGIPAGTDPRPARLVDVLPTICDLMSLDSGSEFAGHSLLTAPSGGEPVSYFEALSANFDYGWAPLRGVISEGKKFIQLPLPELYDLGVDPTEKDNLILAEPEIARRLAALLPSEPVWPPTVREVTSNEMQALRSLGYVVGDEKPRLHYTEEDDPKNLVELDRKITALPRLYTLGKLDEAVTLAREVVSQRPTMTLGQLYLARLLLARNEVDEAIAVLEGVRRLGSASREVLVQLSLVLTQTGRPSEALSILDPLLPTEPETDVLDARASALIALGRFDEATALLAQARKLDPLSVSTLELESALALEQARYQDARGLAEQAIAMDGSRPDSWNNLGVALYFLGLPGEAIQAWETVLRLAPQHPDALLSLGVVVAEMGRNSEARDYLQRFMYAARSPRYTASRLQAQRILRQLGVG